MKMYTDLTVEGTPEEVAAFKHIDAALTARNRRPAMKAIEGPKLKPPPKKVVSKRVAKRNTRAPKSNDLADAIVSLAQAKDGVSTNEVAEYLEMDKKTAYNRLYHLKSKGVLKLGGDGLYRAHAEASA